MRFYVYELSDDLGVVFYVGKGSGRRMWQHKYKATSGENTPRAERIRLILANGGAVRLAKVFETDNEAEAYRQEVRLIARHGRDALTNQTRGGCGIRELSTEARERIAASRRGRKASEETRQKQRSRKLGNAVSDATKAKISATQTGLRKPWAVPPQHRGTGFDPATFRGRKHTPETIEKMRAAKLGHVVSEETRRKISDTKRRRATS